MKEISRVKRLEVAQCYLLGYTYKEIEEKTGMSRGSIANIVSEIENGILTRWCMNFMDLRRKRLRWWRDSLKNKVGNS